MFRTLVLTTALLGTTALAPYAQEMVALKDMPAGTYMLDKSHASLTFSLSHMGLSNYTARFTGLESTLTLNPTAPEQSKVTARVDPASIETDFPYPEKKDFDKELATGKDWLNSTAFPTITFTSTKLVKTGEKTGKMTGDLTFMGVTKPLTFDVTFNGAYTKKPISGNPAVGFSAVATLKRSEWGLSTYVPMVGDEVTLRLETEFEQLTPQRPE